MDTIHLTAVAELFGIAAILSFLNDRFLRLQHDIGLLLLAGLTTAVLRVRELFVPSEATALLHQLTKSFKLTFAVAVFSISVQGLTIGRMVSQERLGGLLR